MAHGDTRTVSRERSAQELFFGTACTALRLVLAFVLAFGTTLWAQSRLAGDAFAAGGDKVEVSVIDVAVFPAGTTKDAYAYATSSAETRDKVCAVIESRGDTLEFQAGVEWNDEKWEYESSLVTWGVEVVEPAGSTIARITPAGVLEAAGTEDGTVRVTATVAGADTKDGADLVAAFLVELRGQTDTKYVTGITICDDAGAPIDPSYRFEEGTLATAMLELQATVTVHDPAADGDVAYQVTPSSGLAAQTGGEMADLLWESADTRLGTVSEEGIYRPVVEGTNIVYAYSNAGFNGQRITASATIDMPGEESGDYHPQDNLTVKVYYESAPDQEVASVTYSIDDLEGLGTVTHTYTALRGSSGFFTTTGRGPLLTKVLKDAGVNTEGVARLRFGTPDNYQGVVSWDMLVDSDRYYFPNIDTGSFADKVQVPPIIAIESHRNVGTDTMPNYDMDDQRRFLLLFGAKDTGETTTNLQVYNIHTLYVELEGAPPVVSTWRVDFIDSITGGVIYSTNTADPNNVGAPEAPAHDGYTFTGWSKSVDEAARVVTYSALYDADSKDDEDKKDEDPGKKDEDPGKKDEDPGKKDEDPGKKDEDPGKKDEDPGKKDEDPGKKDEDPDKKGGKKDESPDKKDDKKDGDPDKKGDKKGEEDEEKDKAEPWSVKFVDELTGSVIATDKAEDPDKAPKPDAPAHDGYAFQGWSKSVDEDAHEVTFTATYKKDDEKKEEKDPEEEKPDKQDSPGNGDDRETPANNGNASGSDAGGSFDLIDANGSPDADGTAGGESGTAQDATVTQLSSSDLNMMTPGRLSMIQAINRHPSNVADLMYENPFAPYAVPLCVGVFVAGGLEALLRFLWQKRVPK